ncbi:L,D-transpeptidase family protein [Massilia sp. PAMC28688]|uniref:L,D-transpeptidase family protein n=1 Tax=Massilia sp. PAMC28688 TaxID=2861283 RepID=UPI001C62F5D0|nr:L,D-transpeptidase family protein [Massilia sp. PAMC28688]QYF92778.1 L,D-transpeptidase family protein [Massilia sp. PAMC28688]
MPTRLSPFVALAVSALLALTVPTARAAPADDIRSLAAGARQAAPRAERPYDERDWLERFYAPRAFTPVWLEHGPARAAAAVALLQGADSQGLAPSDYQAAVLEQRLRAATPDDASFDVALTRAMLHFLADLRVGRVRSEYHTAGADPRLKQFDPVEQLRQAIAQDNLTTAGARAEPRIALYQFIKQALAAYRALARQPAITLTPLDKGARVDSGDAYAEAHLLRAQLQRLGDLGHAAPAGPDTVYSAELAAAVKRFQARHGLLDDGVLGRDTIGALNTPLATRVRQLELTLERLRWLPDFSAGPVVAVNLPAYRLWAISNGVTGGPPPLEMRVIVGTAVKTQTPLFVGHMRYLEFNPYWNVPPSIARGELLPKMASNSQYLVQNNMELVPVKGGAPTQHIDAATLAAARSGAYRIRQRPGPINALGAVKFAMPNPDNIYLHSTSARELFKRTRRDLSHGCIRVEQPHALAKFVLADKPEWTEQAIAHAMTPGTPSKTVSLKTTIPVVLFYATAIAGRDGQAIFSPDIYRRDAQLEQALTRRQPQ